MSKRIKEDNDNAMKFAKLLSEYDFVKIKMDSVRARQRAGFFRAGFWVENLKI